MREVEKVGQVAIWLAMQVVINGPNYGMRMCSIPCLLEKGMVSRVMGSWKAFIAQGKRGYNYDIPCSGTLSYGHTAFGVLFLVRFRNRMPLGTAFRISR